VASWYAVLNPCYRQEELRGTLLGHLVYLKAKAGGEKSTPEKRVAPEHAEGADLQDPCDMAKAGWLESQSPEVHPHTHGYSVSQQCCQDKVIHLSQPETSTR
jgi:hypothetical protein